MLRLALGLWLLAALIALLPPGLCPCWLTADPAALHPHLGQPAAERHGHGYLLEIFTAQPAAAAPEFAGPAAVLLALLAVGAAWRNVYMPALNAGGWHPTLDFPPPRLQIAGH
jgi:hypothetical protein